MTIRWILGIAILTGAFGCRSARDKQLADINKDWNKLIRASHVYPVYPLTQDLQPGDIFLVSKDIEDLTAWEQDDGYLKLDHQIARLNPFRYEGFYSNSFAFGTNALPHFWLKNNSWTNAPSAAFPSYTFNVRQGVGANVSLPIQGIPVGLSLMGAKNASGYVTLAGANTYGVDELSLQIDVDRFVERNGPALRKFFARPNETNYLQVVSRVYTVSHVSVSMLNDSSAGGSLWGGSPKDVQIPSLVASNAAANYSSMVNAVNGTVPGASAVSAITPGGTLKFTSVSQRAVSMEEDFPKPIVIGYVGFTVPITAQADETNPVKVLSRQSTSKTISDLKANSRKKK
jgi:hypothetical protein